MKDKMFIGGDPVSRETVERNYPLSRSEYNFSNLQIDSIKEAVAEGKIKEAQERILDALDEKELEYRASSLEPIVVGLKHCIFLVFTETNYVETVFPDGFTCGATREDSNQNRIEAESQGYPYANVWKSLVEHEYLHSLISELLYDRPSLVLETESGRKFHPSWLRYQEEAIVIATQYLINRDINEINSDNLSRLDYETSMVFLSFPGPFDLSIYLGLITDKIRNLWSQIEKDSQ